MSKQYFNLRNTWCKNTKENYDTLVKMGVSTHFEFKSEYEHLCVDSFYQMWACRVYANREIVLKAGMFIFAEDD